MKKFVAVSTFCISVSVFVAPGFAQMKPCEDLKTEIVAKLDAKGVKDSASRLAIVAAEDVKDQKVVGSCEAGKKKITYSATPGAASANEHSSKPAQKSAEKSAAN
jgi:hypothetical protein